MNDESTKLQSTLKDCLTTFSCPCCRVARSPQEGNWWCDPEQPGYAFILNAGIKTWCEENN